MASLAFNSGLNNDVFLSLSDLNRLESLAYCTNASALGEYLCICIFVYFVFIVSFASLKKLLSPESWL